MDVKELDRVLWLDIETRKVPAPLDWGYARRWSVFMIGYSSLIEGKLKTWVKFGEETELIEYLKRLVNLGKNEIRYIATREFDEMILRGRFTNARRAHKSSPGPWPNVDGMNIIWRNLRGLTTIPNRDKSDPRDCESKDCPVLWGRGEKDRVIYHCYWDVREMALTDLRRYELYPHNDELVSVKEG